ncbi:MAG: D-2-hydroxyacid dehydrogenase [Gammaproteobacteria bacterium AqS3]|nr:D-2-hydroxyacid dehydrogenase [Gammaproteobacteria bacterium AqS3]
MAAPLIATTPAGERALRQHAPEIAEQCRFLLLNEDGSLPADASEAADILLVFYDLFFTAHVSASPITENLSAVAGECSWVQAGSAGWDDAFLGSIKHSARRYCNASGVHAPSIANYVFAHFLAHCKRLDLHRLQQAEHIWQGQGGDGELTEAHLGIVGYGGIGREIARLGRAFNMHITAIRRSPQPDPHADEVWGTDRLDELIAQSAYLALCAPHSSETEGLLDARRLALMPEGSVLVNVGRGSAIVEADLIEALKRGRPAYAAIDTTATEPLPEDSPLWDTPNLYISPHDSAFSPHSVPRLMKLFAENIRRHIAGEELLNLVTED